MARRQPSKVLGVGCSRHVGTAGGPSHWKASRGALALGAVVLARAVRGAKRRIQNPCWHAALGGGTQILSSERMNKASAVVEEQEDEERMSLLNWDFLPRFVVKGTVLPLVATPVLLVALEMLIVDFVLPQPIGEVNSTLVNVAGVLVSLLTVFRTQEAYGRYWEARSSLGRLLAGIVDTASSSSAWLQTIGSSESERRRIAAYLKRYTHEVTSYLLTASVETKRGTEYWRDQRAIQMEVKDVVCGWQGRVNRIGADLEEDLYFEELSNVAPRTRPLMVLSWARGELHKAAHLTEDDDKPGKDKDITLGLLTNGVLPSLMSLQSEFNTCAKIATTPFPRAYTQMDRLIRFAYVFSLPFIVYGQVGLEGIPLVSLLAFGFYGLDAVATQLQHPFVSCFGDAALDGSFTESVCEDIDAVLLQPQRSSRRSPSRGSH